MKTKTLILIFFYCSLRAIGQVDIPVFEDIDSKSPIFKIGSSIIIDGNNHKIKQQYKAKFAVIEHKGKRAIIDTEYDFIIRPNDSYYRFESFGIIKTNNRRIGLYNYKGEQILETKYQNIIKLNDETVAITDLDKTFFLNTKTGNSSIAYCKYLRLKDSKELFLVSNNCEDFKLLSIRTFEEIDDLKYTNPRSNSFGSSYILEKSLKTGALKKDGTILIPFNYTNLHDDFDLLIAQEKSKWGVINKDNETLISFKYDTIYPLTYSPKYGDISERIYIVKLGDRFGLIDGNEKEIIDIKYEFLQQTNVISPIDVTEFEASHFICMKNNQYGLISFHSEIKIPFNYDFIEHLEYTKNYKVVQNGKVGIIDLDNQIVVPVLYDQINTRWHNFKFETKIDQKNGIVDINKGTTIEAIYDNLQLIFGKYYKASINLNNNYYSGYIELNGNEILPVIYKEIHQVNISETYQGLIIKNTDNKMAFYSKHGKPITNFVFDSMEYYTRESILVEIADLVFEIDQTGQCIGNCPSDRKLNKLKIKMDK